MADGDEPLKRHAAGLRDHVHLGDAAFDEAGGEFLLERNQPGIEHEVAVERHDALVLGGAREQRLGIGRDQPLGGYGSRRLGRRLDRLEAEPRRADPRQRAVDVVEQLLRALAVAVGVGRAGVEAIHVGV